MPIRSVAGQMHSEFCGAVDLGNQIRDLGDNLADDFLQRITKQSSLAADVLGKTARVLAGAHVILGARDVALRTAANSAFCTSWYHDRFRLRNMECWYGTVTMQLETCQSCIDGYLPCSTSMASDLVQRGTPAAKAMRNRFEHYEAYMLGNGDDQRAATSRGLDQRAAEKPQGRSWVEHSAASGTDGVEIRIDVHERAGLRAFVLDVEKTVEALRPVVQAVVNDPRIYDRRHAEMCRYCN